MHRIYVLFLSQLIKYDLELSAAIYAQQTSANIAIGEANATASTAVAALSMAVATQSNAVYSQLQATQNQMSSQNTSISGIKTALSGVQGCALLGLIYNQATGLCLTADIVLPLFINGTACSALNVGSMRLRLGLVYFCDGTAWALVSKVKLGSAFANPAASCQDIITAGDYSSAGLYWLALASGAVFQQVCVGSANFGGDGSTTAKVAYSCATVSTYFGLNATKAYVHAGLNSSLAIQVSAACNLYIRNHIMSPVINLYL